MTRLGTQIRRAAHDVDFQARPYIPDLHAHTHTHMWYLLVVLCLLYMCFPRLRYVARYMTIVVVGLLLTLGLLLKHLVFSPLR